MTATDSGGAVATKSVTINPNKATVTYNAPLGAVFNTPTLTPTKRPAPTTIDWTAGAIAQVQAPYDLVVNGVNVEWDSWSDGAAQGRTDDNSFNLAVREA